ncbi:trypsin-like serine protease [Myxococcus sp. K38C18041901]|uniref:S1 family peptidase n=1 Tax=Myxococcus guangdongensis TaxID=2906760 RepID=UPI0020A7DE7F|nr:trypsin-like serine protease [Myxococcus guangdongensis]MCP3062871.1 trypsin-like serine protease [Myxococcus guangdongensis]
MTRGAWLLLLAMGLACTPVTEDRATWGEGVSRVVEGTPAPEDVATVALLARRTRCSEPSPLLLCSGVLIAPDVVLTAAHCLDLFGPEGAHEVFLGRELMPRPSEEGRFVRVARAVIHPRYEPKTHAYDVALLRLASPVNVAPAQLPSAVVPMPGERVRAVGYGDTKDVDEPAGQRRQGVLSVTGVEPTLFRAGPSPGMSCVGDSGGPVFARDDAGRDVLVGITVSGDVACREEAVNVRVDALMGDFIEPFLALPAPAQGSTLSPEALCLEDCENDAQCPSGLACVVTEGIGRCLLPALREGDFGASCTEDVACGVGGLCARLEPEGTDACRCFTPCTPPPPDPEPPGAPSAGGCSSAPGLALLGILLLAGVVRRPWRAEFPV